MPEQFSLTIHSESDEIDIELCIKNSQEMAHEIEQTSGKHSHSRTIWLPKDVKLFVDLLLEYKTNGEMRNNNFGKSWTKICNDYNSKAEFKQNQDQLTQKFNRFRVEWRSFKELYENYTKLEWDSVNEAITTLEEHSTELIKKNKEFNKFKFRSLEYNKDLTELFQKKNTSVGGSAFAPSYYQVNENLGVEKDNPNEFVCIDDDNDMVPKASKSSRKKSISDRVSLGSKAKNAKKTTSREYLFLESATQACIAKSKKYEVNEECLSEKCMDALYELEDEIVDDAKFIKATESFMDPAWRPLFMKMTIRH